MRKNTGGVITDLLIHQYYILNQIFQLIIHSFVHIVSIDIILDDFTILDDHEPLPRCHHLSSRADRKTRKQIPRSSIEDVTLPLRPRCPRVPSCFVAALDDSETPIGTEKALICFRLYSRDCPVYLETI